ncbi:hypothetical protein [Micromonospora sp. NPDC007230]|uniref:hypothetical protein n=1 Tax=Micromonospora sp. NPDC007230 TaxID=3364237 RepID=UPI0036A84352
MEPADLLPDDSGAEIYRCRDCGTHRVCRTGWRTRCHVCLDERSAGLALAAGEGLLSRLPLEPALADQVRRFASLAAADAIPARVAAEFQAAIALGGELDRRCRDGWTDLVGDVHGLPWYGARQGTSSHGTWGVHTRCRSWQRLRDRACPKCPPEPGDRSFTALRDTSYLLYLVRHRGLLKFGVGGARRVRQHLLAGAELVEVVEGRHADVIAAEAILKRQKREAAVPVENLADMADAGLVWSGHRGGQVRCSNPACGCADRRQGCHRSLREVGGSGQNCSWHPAMTGMDLAGDAVMPGRLHDLACAQLPGRRPNASGGQAARPSGANAITAGNAHARFVPTA